MNDEGQMPAEKDFLRFLKNMAAKNKLTLDQFVIYCLYTSLGILMRTLRTRPSLKMRRVSQN